MQYTKISELPIATGAVAGTEYIIIDNTETTRRTPLVSLSSVFTPPSNIANWDNTYTTVNTYSAQWAEGGSGIDTDVRALTSNWDTTYQTVCSLSGKWDTGSNIIDTGVRGLTSNWDTTYQTVCSLSAQWAEGGSGVDTGVRALTSNWDNTYTDFKNGSSYYACTNKQNTYTSFQLFKAGITVGSCHTNNGNYSTIAGGTNNKLNDAQINNSFIGGGNFNEIYESNYSAILGGQGNIINQRSNAFIIGSGIAADQDDTTFMNRAKISDCVFAQGFFASTGNSDNWTETYNCVNTQSNQWNASYSTVNSCSAAWSNATNSVFISQINTSSYVIPPSAIGGIITYTGSSPVTAFVSPSINTQGYNTSISQLSTGSVTIKLSGTYTDGCIISYGDLFETAGKGATASIIRVSNNNFLLNGILQ